METEEKMRYLENLHTLDIAAARMLESIDTKLEGATTDTVPVNVEALKLVRLIMSTQRTTLAQFVEHTLETDDLLDNILTKHDIKID